MKNLYYEIWADAIVYEKTKHGHFRNWKIYTILPMSIIQGVNMATFFFLLLSFGIKIKIFLDINFIGGRMTEGAISGFITLFLPFIILNYFLVFRNKRYEKIIERNGSRNGKLYLSYAIISSLMLILPLIIAKLLY